MGWAGQGANSPTAELGQGRVRLGVSRQWYLLEILLARDGESENWKRTMVIMEAL